MGGVKGVGKDSGGMEGRKGSWPAPRNCDDTTFFVLLSQGAVGGEAV